MRVLASNQAHPPMALICEVPDPVKTMVSIGLRGGVNLFPPASS